MEHHTSPTMMPYRGFMFGLVSLGSLYMLHLLATDYIAFRTLIGGTGAVVSRALLASRGKRDLTAASNLDINTNLTMNENNYIDESKLKLDWSKMMNKDSLNCLPSLICQIIAGAEENSIEAQNIRKFIEYTYSSAPNEIKNAYNHGLIFLDKSEMCYSEYPFCIYSAKTMLKILKYFIEYNML